MCYCLTSAPLACRRQSVGRCRLKCDDYLLRVSERPLHVGDGRRTRGRTLCDDLQTVIQDRSWRAERFTFVTRQTGAIHTKHPGERDLSLVRACGTNQLALRPRKFKAVHSVLLEHSRALMAHS